MAAPNVGGCDVCGGESGEPYVGVAAVPGAPVSVAWCRGCLANHAVPRFVADTWLFLEFDPEYMVANGQAPIPLPDLDDFAELVRASMAEWALEQSVWIGGGYKTIRDAIPELWQLEKERRMTDEKQDDKTEISERAVIAPAVEVPEEIEERLKREREEGGDELALEE